MLLVTANKERYPEMSLLELFCDVDDFCQAFEGQYAKPLSGQGQQKRRQPGLCASEMITIVVHFHQSGYRNFKGYYTQYVQKRFQRAFPELVSYSRFVQLMPRIMLHLWAYVLSRCGLCTGISFIDSTPL